MGVTNARWTGTFTEVAPVLKQPKKRAGEILELPQTNVVTMYHADLLEQRQLES